MRPRRKAVARNVAARFGNRVVRTGTAQAGQFLANPDNWRIHPVDQQDVLDRSLAGVGFVQGVIVNLRTDPSWGESQGVETLVDGHLRVSLALSRGEEIEVPVTYVDLTPAEEAFILATLDPIGAMATTDKQKRDEILAKVPDELQDVAALLHAERATSRTVTFESVSVLKHRVLVECEHAAQAEALAARLRQEGYTCRSE